MSVATSTLNMVFSSDAAFRAWASGISTQLAALGLVKVAVTGEINLATATRAMPSWSSYPYDGFASSGFQIWRFNDVLQTNFPVYFRVDYGSQLTGSYNAGYQYGCALGITIGSAYAGTAITTRATAMKKVYMASDGSIPCYFSGSSSRFALACGGSMTFGIERFKDAGGSDTGRGVHAHAQGWHSWDGSTLYGADSCWQMAMLFAGTNPTPETKWRTLIPTIDDGTVNTDVTAFTAHPMSPRMEQAILNHVVYFVGDLADTTDYPITVSGRPRTYKALGAFDYVTNERPTEVRVAMRWE